MYTQKKASKQHIPWHNCILQEFCKSRDVDIDLFYLSGEITALEIAVLHIYELQINCTRMWVVGKWTTWLKISSVDKVSSVLVCNCSSQCLPLNNYFLMIGCSKMFIPQYRVTDPKYIVYSILASTRTIDYH